MDFGFFLGTVAGIVLTLLFLKYVTVYRLFMGLITLAGLGVWAVGGFFLAWSFRGFFPPEAGATVGALAWLVFCVKEWES